MGKKRVYVGTVASYGNDPDSNNTVWGEQALDELLGKSFNCSVNGSFKSNITFYKVDDQLLGMFEFNKQLPSNLYLDLSAECELAQIDHDLTAPWFIHKVTKVTAINFSASHADKNAQPIKEIKTW